MIAHPVGAVVKTSVRRLVLHLSAGYPLQELFRRICRRLEDWPVAAPAPATVQQNSG